MDVLAFRSPSTCCGVGLLVRRCRRPSFTSHKLGLKKSALSIHPERIRHKSFCDEDGRYT